MSLKSTLCLATGVLAGSIEPARSQTVLSSDSPFMPPLGTMSAQAGPRSETLELAGASITSEGTQICVFDSEAKRSRWISVGSASDQIQVISYDASTDQAVVKINGLQKVLALRKSTVSRTAPLAMTASPQNLTFASGGLPTVNTNGPTGIVPQQASYTPPQPPSSPSETRPAEVAKQEQEARMLVSDLLEISIQQRKAYEEAQKAAMAKAGSPR